MDESFETRSVRMEPMFLLIFQSPLGDVERVMDAVINITPLAMGKYDRNAYQSAEGIERYRPLAGAVAGAEEELRLRPRIVELSFEIPRDDDLVSRVIETIFQHHSYQEPVIRIIPILSSRSKGLDDSGNPNRWWNTTGDWKESRPG